MPAHTHSAFVAHAHVHHSRDRSLGVGDNLFHKSVVRRANRTGLAHHGHRHLIEHRVAFQRKEAR